MSRLKKIADIEIMAADEDTISKFTNPKAIVQYKVDNSVVARIFVAREPGKNPNSKGREVFYVEYSDGSYDVSRGPGISGFESLEKKVIVRFGDTKLSRQTLQGISAVSFNPDKSSSWSKYIENKFEEMVEQKVEGSNLDDEAKEELLDSIDYNRVELINKTDEEISRWIDDEIADLVKEIEPGTFEVTLEYIKANQEFIDEFIDSGKQMGYIVESTKAVEAKRMKRSVIASQISGNRLKRNVKLAASWIDLINLTKNEQGESLLETETDLLATYLDDPSGYAFKVENGQAKWKDPAGPPNAFIVKVKDAELYLTIFPDAIQSELTLQDDLSVTDEKFLDTNNIDHFTTFESAESNLLANNPTIVWRVLPNDPDPEVSDSKSWKDWEYQQWEKFYHEHKEEMEESGKQNKEDNQTKLDGPQNSNELPSPSGEQVEEEDLNAIMKIDLTLNNTEEARQFLEDFETQGLVEKIIPKGN